MSVRRWARTGLAALLLALPAMAPMAAGRPALPALTDVSADAAAAARRGEPLLVLVSLPRCHYCDTVRQGYLAKPAATGELVVRELDMSADTPLRDADGKRTSARAWARAQGVRVAPTVLFLDARGRPAAPALRGIQPDFYGAYLEQRLEEARGAVRGQR